MAGSFWKTVRGLETSALLLREVDTFFRVIVGCHPMASVRANTRAFVLDMELGCLLLPKDAAICCSPLSFRNLFTTGL